MCMCGTCVRICVCDEVYTDMCVDGICVRPRTCVWGRVHGHMCLWGVRMCGRYMCMCGDICVSLRIYVCVRMCLRTCVWTVHIYVGVMTCMCVGTYSRIYVCGDIYVWTVYVYVDVCIGIYVYGNVDMCGQYIRMCMYGNMCV